MANKLEHIVKELRYSIELDNKEEAHDVQSKISLLQESTINSLLNTVLNKFSDEYSIYKFDKIELNLGTIDKSNYEKELPFRLEEQLVNYFNENIRDNGSLRNGSIIVLNNRNLNQFEHFLLRGYLEWDTPSIQQPSKLLQELLSNNRVELVKMLKEHGKKEAIRKRLILQFNDEALENIVLAHAKTESDYFISYKKNMLQHQHKNHLIETTFSDFRNAVWEVVFAYLFVESGSYYNKKNFLQYLINQLSKKYNLKYESLLEVITKGLNKKENATTQLEFKRIILELETEQRIKSQKVISTLKSSDKEVEVWIEQLKYYLKFGVFNISFQLGSKSEFNEQLVSMLKAKNRLAIHVFREEFREFASRNKLLTLLTDEALSEIIKVLTIPIVTELSVFFKVIENNTSVLSAKSRALFHSLNSKKSRLIFTQCIREESLDDQLLYQFLVFIKNEFPNKEKIFIQLLEEVQSLFSTKYKKLIVRFIQDSLKFHKKESAINEDKALIGNIVSDIVNFTNNNEKELWHYWFKEQLAYWISISGLSKAKLFKQCRIQLIKRIASPSLIAFVEKVENMELTQINNDRGARVFRNESDTSHEKNKEGILVDIVVNEIVLQMLVKDIENIQLSKVLFSEWSRKVLLLFKRVSEKYKLPIQRIIEATIQYLVHDVSKSGIHNQLENLMESSIYNDIVKGVDVFNEEQDRRKGVYFVLEKGVLPWWLESYSWEAFNTDIIQLLDSNIGKSEFVKRLKKSFNSELLIHYFSITSIQRIVEEFDGSESKIHSQFVAKINQLLKEKLLPLALVTDKQFLEFQTQIVYLMLNKSLAEIESGLFGIIEHWILSINITNNKSLEILFINLISDFRKKAGSSALNKKSDILLAKISNTLAIEKTNNSYPKSIEEFIKAYKFKLHDNYKISIESTFDELVKIIKVSNNYFVTTLVYNEFRESLVHELEEKYLVNIILLNLNANQKQFFVESLGLLNGCNPFVSYQEYKVLKEHYFSLLFLKFSTGGFSSWTIEHWAHLLFKCMSTLFGEARSNEIWFKTNEKLMAFKENEYKKGVTLLNEIHRGIMNNIKEDSAINNNKEEKTYRKLGEETPRDFSKAIFIKNGGLIILAPYLGMLFEKCGLTLNGEFIDELSKYKAVHLLEFAASGKSGKEEHELVINKLLCGMLITDTVDRNIELDVKDKEIVNGLLTAVTQQWKPLNGTSIDGLRTSFLMRDGKLDEGEEQYFLKIEQKAYDMLLDQISWNITQIKLSWMKKILIIEWR